MDQEGTKALDSIDVDLIKGAQVWETMHEVNAEDAHEGLQAGSGIHKDAP